MTNPCIITVAITGALPTKQDTPAVPVTPSEQIESTHEAYVLLIRRSTTKFSRA
jgi:uncharacterized protein (DUF849 family)